MQARKSSSLVDRTDRHTPQDILRGHQANSELRLKMELNCSIHRTIRARKEEDGAGRKLNPLRYKITLLLFSTRTKLEPVDGEHIANANRRHIVA